MPNTGQYRFCEDQAFLDRVADHLGVARSTVVDVSVPVPSAQMHARPGLIGRVIRFGVTDRSVSKVSNARLLPEDIEVSVTDEAGKRQLSYSFADLAGRSRPRWRAFCAWLQLMRVEAGEA